MRNAFLSLFVASGLAMPAFAETTAMQTSLPAPWAAQDGDVIAFDVLRKGNRFGSHVLTFSRDENDDLSVQTDVDLRVKIGPLTVYRYRLDSEENWVDGQLVSLEAEANNDGKRTEVSASATDAGLTVESSMFNGVLPADIVPSSHWNITQVFGDQMLSTETGEVLDIEVENLGTETLSVDGEALEVTRYRLVSDLTVDIWYDEQSRWVKLSFEARGQEIEYVLTELY